MVTNAINSGAFDPGRVKRMLSGEDMSQSDEKSLVVEGSIKSAVHGPQSNTNELMQYAALQSQNMQA